MIKRLPDIIRFHFVGCKYGYGKPEELSDCKYSVETALELSGIIDEIISARGGAD